MRARTARSTARSIIHSGLNMEIKYLLQAVCSLCHLRSAPSPYLVTVWLGVGPFLSIFPAELREVGLGAASADHRLQLACRERPLLQAYPLSGCLGVQDRAFGCLLCKINCDDLKMVCENILLLGRSYQRIYFPFALQRNVSL